MKEAYIMKIDERLRFCDKYKNDEFDSIVYYFEGDKSLLDELLPKNKFHDAKSMKLEVCLSYINPDIMAAHVEVRPIPGGRSFSEEIFISEEEIQALIDFAEESLNKSDFYAKKIEKNGLEHISRLCYELYKVDWKHSHMITPDREMDSIKDYYEMLLNEHDSDEFFYTYENYLEDVGYSGELYVCYEEFCEAEYLDRDYIHSLLNNESLFAVYQKDMLVSQEQDLDSDRSSENTLENRLSSAMGRCESKNSNATRGDFERE